ncbi:hypothetical protein RISK_003083 [Rhodopirellula islandica]|uniref:Probable inorganic carbon transporter subunit DabA n=1 Tax=Rhodopirellula islandica TaxID=595434 RepID=A0A0J1BE52_RHOIS|nr:DUF2309 domain-containing protein [Rhodopirellula islandica]KLU04815.1 hypothetical protein RISK_003083 [Rhodopirellula islandica]
MKTIHHSSKSTSTSNHKSNDPSLSVFVPAAYEDPHVYRQLEELLDQVCEAVSPVWPLKDWVAVNPYAGFTERSFFESRDHLQVFSQCELLPTMEHFASQFRSGALQRPHIEAAVNETATAVQNHGADQALSVVDEVLEALTKASSAAASKDCSSAKAKPLPPIATIASRLTAHGPVDWTEMVHQEIGKHCSAHYDEGQSKWGNPWQNLPLYQAWRNTARCDRGIEILGLPGFRKFVNDLPHTAEATIVHLLQRMNLPRSLWETFLLAHVFSMPGWSGWTKYQGLQTDPLGSGKFQHDDFRGFLAMSLAYDVAISEAFAFEVDWTSRLNAQKLNAASSDDSCKEFRKILLRASEIAYRDQLLDSLPSPAPDASESAANLDQPASRPIAQMAFCIDVRSERLRRHLESVSADIETIGVAGFFGLPFEYIPLGQASGDVHAPVLLKSSFSLQEKASDCVSACSGQHPLVPHSSTPTTTEAARRTEISTWKKRWKQFQTSAVGCFSFVETMGLLDGIELVGRLLGKNLRQSGPDNQPGVTAEGRTLSLDLDGLLQQGIDLDQQTDLAEGLLTTMGLTNHFAPLVVLCGHASQTDNNAMSAGLDCGACGGHSGAPNARLAATLLNDRRIQTRLAERGIEIGADTHFLAAWHNTTTDQIEWLDTESIPPSHQSRVSQLQSIGNEGSELTRCERLPLLDESSSESLAARAADWSQTRPEWGLAGNASMLIGPRSLTREIALDGRAFLHSYHAQSDPSGRVLESIMTAPMVVAHWINMQYYASTVDSHHFGSGCKTVHNVVGQFGIFSGNGGDLQAGLPEQSLRNGEHIEHIPLRLQTVVVANREAIDRVIAAHTTVRNLLQNGWVHLVAIENDQKYRYQPNGSWVQLQTNTASFTSQREKSWQLVGSVE